MLFSLQAATLEICWGWCVGKGNVKNSDECVSDIAAKTHKNMLKHNPIQSINA